MKTDYKEVFVTRHQHGRLFKDLVLKQGALDFKNFLNSSPDAIDVKVNNQKKTKVATILEKEKETESKRYFLCDKNDKIKVGDFIYWEDSIWLLFLKSRDTISIYDKFEALECKHSISWIDDYGKIQEIPCYLIAQTNSTIKTNFRTWNNMITPQPNKNLEIITSRRDIKLGQKFLVQDTAWFVVETDYISVKDIIYLSLTEDKIDSYNDNLEQELANYNMLNKYIVTLEKSEINLGINEEYKINAKIYLNGILYSDNIDFEILEGSNNISITDKTVVGKRIGSSKIKISMKEDKEVYNYLTIKIVESEQNNISYYIDGDSSIKWGRTKNYEVVKTINGNKQETESSITIIDENNLCSYDIYNNVVSITANSDNRTGTIKINAVIDEQEIEKEINIVSLWM